MFGVYPVTARLCRQSLLITDVPTSVLENVCTYLLGTPQDIASTMLACTALNKAAQPAWAVLEGHKKAWCDTCPMPELRGRNVDVEMLRKVVIPWTYGDSTATSSKSRTREVSVCVGGHLHAVHKRACTVLHAATGHKEHTVQQLRAACGGFVACMCM